MRHPVPGFAAAPPVTTTLRELRAQVQLTLCIDVWALPFGQMLRRVGLPLTAPLTAATMALEGPSSRTPRAPLSMPARTLNFRG